MADTYDFETPGFIAIWIGNFDSADEFEEYLHENINEDLDIEEPINRFAKDVGFGFYDHDRQEAEFFGEDLPVDKLLNPFSNSASFASEAVIAAESKGITKANSAILLFDCNYQQNASSVAPITFIGNFNYE